MTAAHVTVMGVGMTDMSRRDLTPEAMAHQAVQEALADAGVEPAELGLILVANAMGGRLCDQGCIRGQSWLRKTGLGGASVVNVDNSCAGGSSALHLATLIARSADRPVLVLGVEKMWTGDRGATLAGIEDGLPADYRSDLYERLRNDPNPAGTVLMGLNAGWAECLVAERGTTERQMAAAAVKARRFGARNPLAQFQRPVDLDEVLGAPRVAGRLTRLMCSSFTDGAAALVHRRAVGGHGGRCAPYHRIRGPIGERIDGLSRATGRDRPGVPGRPSASARTMSTWSSCTTPPAPRSSTPSNAWASSASARPVRPPWPATPTSEVRRSPSTPAAVWWVGGTPWGPPAWPRRSRW